jgi:hypothetical protein
MGVAVAELQVYPYGDVEIGVGVGDDVIRTDQCSPEPMEVLSVKDKVGFKDNLRIDYLMRSGIDYVLKLEPCEVVVEGIRLERGWNTLWIRAEPDVPVLLLKHGVSWARDEDADLPRTPTVAP